MPENSEQTMNKRHPSYMKVYTDVKESIMNDTYPVGSFVPREPDLCAMFGVSRTTVRKAMELLEQEGFVHIQQGSGTEVLNYKATQKLNQVTSFSETLEAQGYTVESKSTYIDMMVPPSHVLEELMQPPDSRVVRIQRIQLANGKPIAIITNYIVADLVPGILSDTGTFVSLYHHLEAKYQNQNYIRQG